MTAQQRADRVAAAMLAADKASAWIGVEFISVNEGGATLALDVKDHHCNGHGMCHGGITYMLADTAFAYACNSRNQSTVAQHNLISYLAPGHAGDRLTAIATEVSLAGRSGIYDVKVTNQDNKMIAEFRGMSRAIRGQLIDDKTGETP